MIDIVNTISNELKMKILSPNFQADFLFGFVIGYIGILILFIIMNDVNLFEELTNEKKKK